MYLLYALVYRCYVAFLRLGCLFNAKAKAFFVIRRRNKLHYASPFRSKERQEKLLWMHCASVGEFEEGRSIIQRFRTAHPEWKVVVSFYSPSGYYFQEHWEGIDKVLALPLDISSHCNEFLDWLRPDHVLWVRYDFWPEIYRAIAERKIPLTVIGGRLHKGHRLLANNRIAKTMRSAITKIFTVDEVSAELLRNKEMSEAECVGDTRYDRVMSLASAPVDKSFDLLINEKSKILVAGSTWGKDHKVLGRSSEKLLHDGWKLIIVPHEVDEETIFQCKRVFEKVDLWSEVGWSFTNHDVLIVDSTGFLSKLYAVADAAYVGGGFESSGVHNVLEPMVYDLPVFCGPIIDRSIEAQEAQALNHLQTINTSTDLCDEIQSMKAFQSKTTVSSWIQNKSGATKIIASYIEESLKLP